LEGEKGFRLASTADLMQSVVLIFPDTT